MNETMRERDTRRRQKRERIRATQEEVKQSDKVTEPQKKGGIVQLHNQKDWYNQISSEDRSLSKLRAQKKLTNDEAITAHEA